LEEERGVAKRRLNALHLNGREEGGAVKRNTKDEWE